MFRFMLTPSTSHIEKEARELHLKSFKGRLCGFLQMNKFY